MAMEVKTMGSNGQKQSLASGVNAVTAGYQRYYLRFY
jgi:hypothetical protein